MSKNLHNEEHHEQYLNNKQFLKFESIAYGN
jgi:hypothetical protein